MRLVSLAALALLGGACAPALRTERQLAAAASVPVRGLLATTTAEAGGLHIRYAELGSGPESVLLLHGFPETLQTWRRVAPELAEHFRVLAPDLPGSGGSDKPDLDYSPQLLAARIADFLDEVGVGRPHVVASDSGVIVAVALACLHPARVGRIVLASGTVRAGDVSGWTVPLIRARGIGELGMYGPLLGALVRSGLEKGFKDPRLLSAEAFSEYMRSLEEPGGRRAALGAMRASAREEPFLIECVKRIDAPSLVVFASKDKYFAVEAGQRFASELRAKLAVVDSGHFIQEERASELSRLVLEHLLAQ